MTADQAVEATNTATGEQTVQAGVINGNVEINSLGAAKPHLVMRYASPDELREARDQFVAPGGFAEARRVLAEESVVVLCGRGAGRSYAARRLLIDRSAESIAHVNPGRSLGGIARDELGKGRGYVWDLTETSGQTITAADFAHAHRVVRSAGASLVVIVDHRSQAGAQGVDHAVQLTTPIALHVAESMIAYSRPGAVDAPLLVLKEQLAVELDDRDPPDKAVRAAKLAIRVADDQLSVDLALRDLRDRAADAVARWFGDWDIREYAFAFTVALLEHEPFDEVVRQAQNLDLAMRQAQLPADKTPRPPQLFAKSKKELLADVQAVVVLRDHPQHTGLQEETVRFERQDWAQAVLRHVWREYPAAHTVLIQWMTGLESLARFFEPVRRALCMITAEVPAHEPLRIIGNLSMSGRGYCRDLAASALAHLADDHNLRPLVDRTLADWMDSDNGLVLCTAALVQATPFGRRDLARALSKLGEIAKSPKHFAQQGVVVATLRLLQQDECGEPVMKAVMDWSSRAGRSGLRQLTAVLGTAFSGMVTVSWFDPAHVVRTFPDDVRLLVARVLRDPVAGEEAIDILAGLAEKARWRKKALVELKQVVALITDDLGWRNRVVVARRLTAWHPTKRKAIRHILRTATRTEPQVQLAE